MKHLQFVMTAILGISLTSLSAHATNAFPGSGNVGIGTPAPDALLHLSSGGPNSIIRLENTDYYAGHSSKPDEPLGVLEFASQFANMGYFSLNNPRAKVEGVNQNFSGGSSLIFYTANSTEADPSQRLRIQADGNVTINSTGAYAAAGARLDVDGQIRLGGGNPGAGKVLTSDANGVGAWTAFTGDGDWSVVGNDMFSSVSGNVGIGSLNSDNPPEQLLHLKTGGPNTTIRLENTSAEAGGAFGGPADEPLGTVEFASQIANQGYYSLNNPRVKITGVAQNASGGAALLFYTANSTEADPTSRMRIMADGSVAINSTGAYAQAKLDVDGQVRIAGGSPGAGKVLTSDENGVGSWETPSGGGGDDGDWTVSGNDIFSAVSGNVGIGIDTPEQLLHLRSGGPNSIIRLENTDYYAGHSSKPDEPLGVLEFASQFANMGYFNLNNPRAKIEGVNQNFSGATSLLFYTANSTEADPTSRMRIMADGSVAINSTGAYAQAKLDVDGQIRLAGGSPGAGKVLTSDENGVGSWEEPSGGGTAGPAGPAGEAGAQGAQGKQGPPGQDASSECVDCADAQTVVFDAVCKIFAGDFSNTAQLSECMGVLASFKLLGTEVCDGTFGGEANCLDFIISNVQDLIDEKMNP